jgi:ribonuclease III
MQSAQKSLFKMTDIDTIVNEFKNKTLINTALTHRSYLNENANSKQSNERMEFLGDAILEFLVSKAIYAKYTNKEEGFLTALRANLVNTINLSRVAKKLDVGTKLLMSRGEEESGGRSNETLLANTIEAIIGAIFLDRGLDSVSDFLDKYILIDLDEIASKPLKDAKSRLQEMVQAKGLMAPKYRVVKEVGPDHNKQFTIEVVINDNSVSLGSGKSKNDAEQNAAEKALVKYK